MILSSTAGPDSIAQPEPEPAPVPTSTPLTPSGLRPNSIIKRHQHARKPSQHDALLSDSVLSLGYWLQAYHSSYNDENQHRNVGNIALLPFTSKVRGPAPFVGELIALSSQGGGVGRRVQD